MQDEIHPARTVLQFVDAQRGEAVNLRRYGVGGLEKADGYVEGWDLSAVAGETDGLVGLGHVVVVGVGGECAG